jgi:hypothetical protein
VLLDGVQWDDAAAALRRALVAALGLSCPLELLHGALPHFSPLARSHSATMAAKRRLLSPLADPDRLADFIATYDGVVRHVVAPHLAAHLGDSLGCNELHYAAVPTLRVQTPSEAHATIRPHFDGMYDLQAGSINFWLPLTAVGGASALWVESGDVDGGDVDGGDVDGGVDEGVGSFHPLTRATRFDGRNRIHFTIPNRSTRTRVSLDFRCVPGGCFDEDSRLARLGYFSMVARCDRTDRRTEEVDMAEREHEMLVERGPALLGTSHQSDVGRQPPRYSPSFHKVASGRVSVLHGLPHTRRPKESQ